MISGAHYQEDQHLDNSIQKIWGHRPQPGAARQRQQAAAPQRRLNVMGQFLAAKSGLSYIEQYNRNIDDGSTPDMSDVSMGTLGDILSRAAEYANQAANDTYNPDDRTAIAEQIDKMIDQVVDLANSTVGGKYIYAGTKNSNPPFQRDGDKIIYSGDTNEIRREVLAGTAYRIDSPGITVAGAPGVLVRAMITVTVPITFVTAPLFPLPVLGFSGAFRPEKHPVQ